MIKAMKIAFGAPRHGASKASLRIVVCERQFSVGISEKADAVVVPNRFEQS